MKTEEFDDAFRRKLDEIPGRITESEVDAVHKYVSSQKTAILYKRRLAYALAASGLLMIVLLTFWNVNLNHKQEELSKTIDSLNQQLTKPETIVSAPSNPTDAAKSTTPIVQNAPKSTLGMNTTKAVTSGSKQTKTNNINNKPIDHKATPSTPVVTKTENIKQEENPTTTNKVQAESNVIKDTMQEAIAIQDTGNNTIEAPDIRNKPIKNKVKAGKSLGVNVGLGFDMGRNGRALNVLAELRLPYQLSVTSGFKWLATPDERFGKPDEFEHQKHENFKEKYEHHQIDTHDIHDIHLKCSYYQVPLFVNYNLPFKRNFSILFSAGTNLTFNSIDKIQYRNTPVLSGNDAPQTIIDKNPGPAFHDLNLSIGLRKKLGHWNVEVSPNLALPLENQPDRRRALFTNAKLRVFYQI